MSKSMSFFVPMVPVAKSRARVTFRGGHARAYTPKNTVIAERMIRAKAVSVKRFPIHDGPVNLGIVVVKPFPRAFSKVKRLAAEQGHVRPVCKPDVDNYAKAVLDALNGVIYNDDSQVWMLTVSKCYGNEPGYLIEIELED